MRGVSGQKPVAPTVGVPRLSGFGGWAESEAAQARHSRQIYPPTPLTRLGVIVGQMTRRRTRSIRTPSGSGRASRRTRVSCHFAEEDRTRPATGRGTRREQALNKHSRHEQLFPSALFRAARTASRKTHRPNGTTNVQRTRNYETNSTGNQAGLVGTPSQFSQQEARGRGEKQPAQKT